MASIAVERSLSLIVWPLECEPWAGMAAPTELSCAVPIMPPSATAGSSAANANGRYRRRRSAVVVGRGRFLVMVVGLLVGPM